MLGKCAIVKLGFTLAVLAAATAHAQQATPIPANVVIIEYSASWCSVCKQMQPLVSAAERAGYPIYVADIEQQRTKTMPGCPTESVPRFVAVDLARGKVLASHDGRMQPQQFKAFVTKWTKPKQPAAPPLPEKPKPVAVPTRTVAYQGKNPPRDFPQRPTLLRSQGCGANSPVVLHRSHSLDGRSNLTDGLTPGAYWMRSYVRGAAGNLRWTKWTLCEVDDSDGDGICSIGGEVGFPTKDTPTVSVQFIRILEPIGVPNDPPSTPQAR